MWRSQLDVRGQRSPGDVVHLGREGWRVDLEGQRENDQHTLDCFTWRPSASSRSISLASVQVLVTGSEKDGGKVVLLLGQLLSAAALPQVSPNTTLSCSTNTVMVNQL